MQSAQAFAAIVAPPRRLAVNRQNRLLDVGRLCGRRTQRLQPVGKTGLKRGWLQQGADPKSAAEPPLG